VRPRGWMGSKQAKQVGNESNGGGGGGGCVGMGRELKESTPDFEVEWKGAL
jgi:hypothetical protein